MDAFDEFLEIVVAILAALLFFAWAALALTFMVVVGAVMVVLWAIGAVVRWFQERKAENSNPKV